MDLGSADATLQEAAAKVRDSSPGATALPGGARFQLVQLKSSGGWILWTPIPSMGLYGDDSPYTITWAVDFYDFTVNSQ